MAFDPAAYEKAKRSLKPVTASGFDPAEYERVRASVAAPQPAQARPGPVGRAIDFTRRAFMGNEVEPSGTNIVQRGFRDAKDMVTGLSHIVGQGVVEGSKLAADAFKSAAPMSMKMVLGQPPQVKDLAAFTESPIAKRVAALPGQTEIAFSPEGRAIAKEDFIKPAAESFGKSFGYEEGKELIKNPTYENVKKFVSAPIKQFSDHPLFTLLDWSTAVDIGGGAVRAGLGMAKTGAEVAGKASLANKLADTLSTARPSLEVAPRGTIARDFSKNPIVKMGIQQPFDKFAANPALQEFVSSSPMLKWLAPDAMLTPEARAGRVATDVANKSQGEFFRLRNARMDEAMTQFNKLPKNERESFVSVIQGRAMPRQMSPQFKEVYEWYKNTVADEQTKLNLPDEVVNRVAFQPLAVANGLLSPDDYKLALQGNTEAATKVRKVTADLMQARVRVQEAAIREWMGINTDLDKRTKNFRTAARDIAEEMTPDPIYFPSVFQSKLKVSDFLPTKFLERFKPGFMKGRTGAFGFIEKEPEVAFAIHQSQVERYLQNEHLITSIKDKFALPLKKATDLKPGWKTFAPDGYLGFYRGSMPLQESFLRGVGMGQNIDDAFTGAVQKVLPSIMPEDKTFIGVRKPNLYQIPPDVARNLQSIITPQGAVPELVKLIWDKPLQGFKFAVLAMSPRWVVNNTLGNMVTTMSGRVSPQSFLKAGQEGFREIIPPEVASGGFKRAEFPGIKKIITPETGWADKTTGFFSGRTPTEGALKSVQNVVSVPFKGAGKIADTVFEANSQIEDLFRNATFIDKTTKAAVEKIAKDTSTGIFDMKQKLDRFLERGSFADSNVAKVAGEMLKDEPFKTKMLGEVNRILNDYNSLTKFERNVIRRAVPFWSWWKFINVLFWSMPIKDPLMAQTLKQLGAAGQEISEKEWKANGLNVKELPQWMRGNVILARTPDNKLIDLLNTRSMNPFSQVTEPPGLAPQFQVFEERRSGRNYLTGQNFAHPNEVESNGSLYRREGGKTERIDRATPPPLLTHLLRQIPQTGMLEALAFPYRTYSGEGVFNNAMRTSRGQAIPLNPQTKIAGILGMPVTEVDYRRLRVAHREAMQADRLIKKQEKRSGRALERVKLGAEK